MQESLQLSTSELKMMKEVFQVFEKYAYISREFGVHIIHSHFPVKKNEILYETHDKKERVLKIVPTPLSAFNKIPAATAWQKSKSGEIKVTMFCCDDDGGSDQGPPIRP